MAGLLETGLNPVLGRISDRRGRLLPIQWALAAAVVVGIMLAFAEAPLVIAGLAVAAAVSFGGFYTPGIALVSDRAEHAKLAQGLAFGVMNTAWAIGALLGPSFGGGLADGLGDAAPYLVSLSAPRRWQRSSSGLDGQRPRPEAAVDRRLAPPADPPDPRPRRRRLRRRLCAGACLLGRQRLFDRVVDDGSGGLLRATRSGASRPQPLEVTA